MGEQPGLVIRTAGKVTIVSFRDVPMLDTPTIQRVAAELYAVVETPTAPRVVLDFGDVRFLSSQTLGVLLTFRRKADKADVKTAIAGIRPELARVFEITHLTQLFSFYPNADEAAAGMQEA